MKISDELLEKSIHAINTHGILLVFPIKNNPEIPSLWKCLYPKTKMNWKWDENADSKVVTMWTLMKILSKNPKVVYSKWFQGRATFINHSCFSSFVRIHSEYLNSNETSYPNQNLEKSLLSREAKIILELLQQDSPLSTKQIKDLAELKGKDFQKFYDRAIRELFQKFLIVGFGEVDDGAFPSLAIASSQNLFENLWQQAYKKDLRFHEHQLKKTLGSDSPFLKFFWKTLKIKNLT